MDISASLPQVISINCCQQNIIFENLAFFYSSLAKLLSPANYSDTIPIIVLPKNSKIKNKISYNQNHKEALISLALTLTEQATLNPNLMQSNSILSPNPLPTCPLVHLPKTFLVLQLKNYYLLQSYLNPELFRATQLQKLLHILKTLSLLITLINPITPMQTQH